MQHALLCHIYNFGNDVTILSAHIDLELTTPFGIILILRKGDGRCCECKHFPYGWASFSRRAQSGGWHSPESTVEINIFLKLFKLGQMHHCFERINKCIKKRLYRKMNVPYVDVFTGRHSETVYCAFFTHH